MVLHNPNNWHWVNKDVREWARNFLEHELVGISAEESGVTAKIDSVSSMEGDCDVSQRKGKVITLFDLRVQLEYSGKVGEETNASGTITIPEVAHDTEEDEYVFEISLTSESSEKEPVKDLVRSRIVPQLRSRLRKLGPALIDEHGKDIQHAPGSNPSSGFTTPKYMSSSHISKDAPKTTSTPTTSSASRVNVTTLTDTSEYRCSASELYKTFTDPDRIAAFTRSKPTLFEGAKKGGRFELFGGNVSGEYTDLEEPTKIVQQWRLSSWPAGHYSPLIVKFDQNDADAVTNMNIEFQGVPVGQEDVVKNNWNSYYVRAIKQTFGFGTIL